MRPSLPDITIRQLEYLVAIADESTWAAAAESVGVSASALSQGLAELERRIGVELFDSLGRRRVLRAPAQPVLDHARQVTALTGDLMAWSQRLRSGASGRLRLGMIDVAAVTYFPTELREFRANHPEVDLTLTVAPSRSLLDDLAAGHLDLAVCVAPPDDVPGVATEPILVESLRVYAPPSTPIGKPHTWGPWVLFPDGSHSRQLVERRLRDLGAPFDVVAESHQPDVVREMVQLGLGWTVLPVSQGATNELVEGERLVDRSLVIARRPGSVTDPVVDELASMLRTAAR